MKKNKLKSFFRKYINGTKGVISLFLAILMVPFVSVAGALVNAGRINSAVAIFDEALCNASNSTLGTYDEFLKKRFGLLAISQNTAGGGTQFGNTSAVYTADQFLNDLFAKYMEQNLGALSNTYMTTDISAQGLYPLAEPKILQNSVLQSGKITVPAKMIADWGSIDKMLSKLTDGFELFESFAKTLSSGTKVVSAVDKLLEKQESLEKQIESCNKARTEYNTAYTAFETAAKDFNSVVDNINYWSGQVTTYQNKLDELDKKVSGINKQIEEKNEKIKEFEEDKENDHTEEIETLKEEIKELEKEREEKASGYTETEKKLNTAKSNLSSYKNRFDSAASTVLSKKNTYYDKIVKLRDEINKTSTAVVAFQDSLKSVINNGATLIGDVITTGFRVAQDGIKDTKNQIKEDNEYYGYQKKLADNEGYTEEATDYYNMIQENASADHTLDEKSRKYRNGETVAKGAVSTMKSTYSGVTEFADRDIKSEYKVIYDALDNLRIKVDGRKVPSSYTRISYSDCYYQVINPLEKAEIKEIVDNIEEQFVKNVGWTTLKAVVGFFQALMSIKLDHDPALKSVIDTGKYEANGGLPSKIDRDVYPLTSPYDVADAAQSQKNKEMLSGYGQGNSADLSGSDAQSLITTIVDNFYILLDGVTNFTLKKLSTIWDAIKAIFNAVLQIGKLAIAEETNKLLLFGYIAYNTANRTTYTGSALTGERFGLPLKENTDGYLFAGAETEYIINGSTSEKENQQKIFWIVLAMRAVLNFGNILVDGTIQTIATTLGSFTFGAGAVATYIIFLFLESLADTIILVNGGDIPIIKTFVYVTPTGIPRLMEKILKLSLSEKDKQKLYETVKDNAFDLNEKAKDVALLSKTGGYGDYYEQSVDLPAYPDYKSQQKEEQKQMSTLNMFTFTYTKKLQLIMIIFCDPLKMTKRLADIIQMEAAYKAATSESATYNFNLDKSYTYVRASGKFTSNVFIKIGEDDILNSKQRVIYNGY